MVPAADVVLVADGIDLLHLAEQVAQIINIMQVQIEQASAAVFGTAIPLAPGGMFRKGHPVFCCIKNQKSYYFKENPG